MKEKMKPMAIYGGIGAASGAAIAYFMKKKDMKNMFLKMFFLSERKLKL